MSRNPRGSRQRRYVPRCTLIECGVTRVPRRASDDPYMVTAKCSRMDASERARSFKDTLGDAASTRCCMHTRSRSLCLHIFIFFFRAHSHARLKRLLRLSKRFCPAQGGRSSAIAFVFRGSSVQVIVVTGSFSLRELDENSM